MSASLAVKRALVPRHCGKSRNRDETYSILKESSFEEFIKVFGLVSAGGTWVQRSAGMRANRSSIRESSAGKTKDLRFRITCREMEIITALGTGRRTREIARDLSITTQAVKHHITNLFDKTGTSSRLELMMFAIAKGLLDNSQQQVTSPMVEADLEPAKSA
jgi:DNA-binding NarL/FixJ family response regulator